ncbi:MAG: pitrilysin family protein [Chitinophagales bacterium]|nr:insulinase family protein [Chitinophagales bacterium]MDW8272816.1 pitrilysin family protein [Chitinophagales bacterium]
MQYPNRAVAPPVKPVENINIPQSRELTLDNGIKLFTIYSSNCEVARLDFSFKAGKWYQPKKLVAKLAARMLREGTISKNAKEIADFFDYYGSNFSTSSGMETATVSLFTLSRYLSEQLPLIFEIFTESAFPEKELQTIIQNEKQSLAINLEKNDFVAGRLFSQALWGDRHPFGIISMPEDYDNIDSEELKKFSQKHYNASNVNLIILSGNFTEDDIAQVNKIFGQKNWIGNTVEKKFFIASPAQEKDIYLEKKDSVQSALAIGNITINKHHPDYIKLHIANTLLGGYFGSRLMSNLREEKGYTYGIHSSLVSYLSGSYLEISSEVGKSVRLNAINEIEKEIKQLSIEPPDEEELFVVKSYLSGKLLRSVDGVFRYAEVLKGLILHQLDSNYILQNLKTIQEIKADEILEICREYLRFEDMYKVSVG